MSQVGHQRGKQADPPPVVHDTWPSLTLSYRLDLFLGGRSAALDQPCLELKGLAHCIV